MQGKLENIQLRRKGAPKGVIELFPVIKEIKKFKETPNAKQYKGNGGFTARPYSANLPTYDKELKKILSSDRDD